MDESRKDETTRLIDESSVPVFERIIKQRQDSHETVIQTKADCIDQRTRKQPPKKFRTSSFWIAETCAPFNVAMTESRNNVKAPYVTGIAFLKDGQLVACDKSNMTIKLFNRDLIMTYELDVGATPYDVAIVDEATVLVSFPDSGILRYILVKPGVKLGRAIHINETCLGITVHKSQIYVCIREGKVSDRTKQIFNGVRVLSMKGKVLYSILHQNAGFPKHVCVSEDGTKIFYTGGENETVAVVCVTKDGHGVFRYSDDMLQCPNGIAMDRHGNLAIGDHENGLLYVVNSEGAKRKYLFDPEDRTKISSIAFKPDSGILVVGRFTTLHAYYLLKGNSSTKGKIELSYSGAKAIDERKCCILI